MIVLLRRKRLLLFWLCIIFGIVFRGDASWGETPVQVTEHIAIIGVGGMSPDAVRKAKTPNMHRLMKEGAFTLHARGVMPTVSSSNCASMIMGAGPEQQGVTSNAGQRDKFEIAPTQVESGGVFPTIFCVLREQSPASMIGVFTDWPDFVRLLEKKAPDVIDVEAGAVETTNHAVAFLKAKRPTLTFIHYDHAGHQYAHGSPAYFAAVAEADRLAGEVLAALDEAGLSRQTIVLVTADHGGKGKDHGGATMAEIEIPWIIRGPESALERKSRLR